MGREKHSEVRPQGGQVYNYKALQHVVGEPTVLKYAPDRKLVFYNINAFLIVISQIHDKIITRGIYEHKGIFFGCGRRGYWI